MWKYKVPSEAVQRCKGLQGRQQTCCCANIVSHNAVKTHIHNNTQLCEGPITSKCLHIVVMCVKKTQRAQNKPLKVDLSWSPSINCHCDSDNYHPTTEAPIRMDLASYLTIRTLLFFKSLIGLADKLIKGDPQSWESWTWYFIFTADWKACTLAPILTQSGLLYKYLHRCKYNQAHTAFTLMSLHLVTSWLK